MEIRGGENLTFSLTIQNEKVRKFSMIMKVQFRGFLELIERYFALPARASIREDVCDFDERI